MTVLIAGEKLIPETKIAGAIPLLFNSKAGALRTTAGAEEIESLAKEVGVDLEVIPTTSADDTRGQIERMVAEGVKRIAIAGGDGTVACAVQALAKTGVTLGIIPQGTANNFATALRLPLDLPSALRVLSEGEEREVDLGQIGDTYFTESAGVGLFADALSLYDGVDKSIFRTFWTYARVLMTAHARRIRLVVDGKPFLERAVWCEVANTFRIGYAVPVAPEAKITDGKLDVVVIGNLKPTELLPYFRAMRAQVHQTLPHVTVCKAEEVRIESRHPMNVHCDDTIIGTTPVTIKAVPRALKVLVDRL